MATTRAVRRLIKGERGQSTAMVVSMLFLLVLFVGLVANVGQAVNRRIALQTLADAGAFTGATVMAVGMNQLAYWNKWLQYLWDGYSTLMAPAIELHVYPFCAWGRSLTSTYNGMYYAIYALMELLNTGFDGMAWDDASHVTDFNAKDLFPGETLDYGEPVRTFTPTYPEELPIYSYKRDWYQVAHIEDVPDGTKTDTVGLVGAKKSFGYGCTECFGPVCVPWYQTSTVAGLWKRKKTKSPLIFVWAVRAPQTRAVAFDWLFGPGAIPEMTAVAAAKPIGGSIQHAEEKYVAKLVPVDKVLTGGGMIADRKMGWLLRRVWH